MPKCPRSNFKIEIFALYFSASQQIHAYDNSAFSGGGGAHEMQERRVGGGGDELEKMGYSVYNGGRGNNPR